MDEKNEKKSGEDWLKNLPLQSGGEGFSLEEMTICPKCERKNAPTRIKCLYCGAEKLPVTETAAPKQLSRKLEAWEKGFNVIFLPDGKISDEKNFAEIAKMLRLETQDLREIFAAQKTLPLARAESESEAEIIVKNLTERGLHAAILSDEKLEIKKPPRRLRGLEFSAEKTNLVLFNGDEIAEIRREDLCLIVTGALFERKIEATRKHQRKGEDKILETTELSSDEFLIDIYNQNDAIGYRIESKGFDFSCLAGEKELLAAQNIKKLARRFQAFAPDANFDEDYNNVRAELSRVWEVEEKKDSKGFQKKGFGKFNLESVTTINNLQQFTRYSRLRRNFL
ncbi:MAG: zinc finger Ran-binding domain-containing protein [Pyrinomonadaceae bacterium]